MGRANRGNPPYTFPAHAHNVERIDQLRARQHPGRACARDRSFGAPVGRLVQDAPPRVPDADQAEAFCPLHELDLSPEEIVRGWEVAKGQFVPIEDAELEALENYDTSKAIEIKQFVQFRGGRSRSTTTAPTTSSPPPPRRSGDPTRCCSRRCGTSGVVGLGSFVLAGKEKLCLIRPKGSALALETLFLAEDVKGQEEIDEPVAATGVKKEELALAQQIISGSRARSSRKG